MLEILGGATMFRKLFIILLIIFAILAAGWFAMRRADIPYDALENTYTSKTSQFTTLQNGLKVHYRDEGIMDGPTLVLVHGFSASLHTWEPWVKELGGAYRIISLDLPGHGLTRADDGGAVNMAGFVAAVDELTDKIGVERFTLAGNSMGGATAWNFALAHPEKLEGLVLVDASGWPRNAADEDERPMVFKLLENPVARFLIKDLDMSGMVESGLKDSFYDASFVTEEMVNRYSSLSRAPGHRGVILDLSTGRDDRPEATPALMATIDVPTLILHGDSDNLVPLSAGKKFGETIPGAELIIYEKVGHLPQEEVASQSASDLRRFLQTRVHVSAAGEDGEAVPVGAPSEEARQ